LLCGPRKSRTDRGYLVNRSVSRIELPRQIIEAHIATGLPDFSFLPGSHLFILIPQSREKNLWSLLAAVHIQ
jgi:hypothetical protein